VNPKVASSTISGRIQNFYLFCTTVRPSSSSWILKGTPPENRYHWKLFK
jgi:hypothetical protein